MLIVPPQLLLYMAVAPEEKIRYQDAGPGGPADFNAGVAGFEAKAFRGCGIFTSTPYEVSDGEPANPQAMRIIRYHVHCSHTCLFCLFCL